MNFSKKSFLDFVTSNHGSDVSAGCERRLAHYGPDDLISADLAISVLREAHLENQRAQQSPAVVPMTSRCTFDHFDEVAMNAAICAAVV